MIKQSKICVGTALDAADAALKTVTILIILMPCFFLLMALQLVFQIGIPNPATPEKAHTLLSNQVQNYGIVRVRVDDEVFTVAADENFSSLLGIDDWALCEFPYVQSLSDSIHFQDVYWEGYHIVIYPEDGYVYLRYDIGPLFRNDYWWQAEQFDFTSLENYINAGLAPGVSASLNYNYTNNTTELTAYLPS